MGYFNLIEVIGYEIFVEVVVVVGVDGFIIVDLFVEVVVGLVEIFDKVGIESIFLIVLMISDKCIVKIVVMGWGYLYYVFLKGVIGVGNLDVDVVN